MNSDDLTFITNENGQSLVKRFSSLIKDTDFLDCLVGYFFTSGFYQMYKSLEPTKKIRILIGIGTDKKTVDLIQDAKSEVQQELGFSSKEAKEEFSDAIVDELENSKDSSDVENGIKKFIAWIKSGKLELRVYPLEKIHAKVYIMTFKEDDRDVGRVITGSSNFSQSGLRDNLEFNVELKNRSDYDFALKKFEELWDNSIDVSDKYIETINQKTWLNDEITPYELYLKFLYEYLKEKINMDKEELFQDFLPDSYMELEYQKDAVRDAKTKLEEYGGVFISDVVGLGKTFMTTMLAQQLDGRTLVIAPPVLLDKENPGSWPNVFDEFGIRQREFESIGKLDKIIRKGTDKFKNIVIDEAHRFRTENTQMYEKLYRICRGKRVILVSATPLNNTPLDILSQIKLFQNAHKSTLPNPKVRDLEKYFKKLQNKLKDIDRQVDKDKYLKIVQENSEDIRENVLQYLMVRRTRNIIEKHYKKDLEKQKLRFPEVQDPNPVYYKFDEDTDSTFNKTLELILKSFKYSRYTPLLYLKEELPENKQTPQRNMGRFMKILLLKRLESSFHAFKQSISRFIYSYKRFIEEFEKGHVYISEKYTNKVFELLEEEEEDAIEKLLEEDKAKRYESKLFTKEFVNDLKHDLDVLVKIDQMWKTVDSDPKLEEFIRILSKDKILKNNKLVVFTESKETAIYLEKKLNTKFDNKVLAFSSISSEGTRIKIIENFDPAVKNRKDNVRILITTDILSEGINLNRSNVVINYDIPWNPIRMMQRVGRINRVAKNLPFDKIYTYNFFPAGQINEKISLKEAAEAKIKAFIEMLGNDSRLLTDEEIKSHDYLFKKLNSKKTITGEEEIDNPEIGYLQFLRDIRDNQSSLFEKIKRLPKKSRTAKRNAFNKNSLLTFFRKGKLRKIYLNSGKGIDEIDFIKAAEILKANKSEKKLNLEPDFYKLLEENKKEFDEFFINEEEVLKSTSSRGNEAKLVKRIRAVAKSQEYTDTDEDYLHEVLNLLKQGSLPKPTIKKILKEIDGEINPLKILAKIKTNIHQEFFQNTFSAYAGDISGPKEVILSEFLIKNE